MGNFKTLQKEMKKLQEQIKTVLCIANYRNGMSLFGLEDYGRIKAADDRQMLEKYSFILFKLDNIQRELAYYDMPIRETGTLHLNGQGMYETDKGHSYTRGSTIEFFRTEEAYNCDADMWEEVGIWAVSKVWDEGGGDYFILSYPDIPLSGLKVRVRG